MRLAGGRRLRGAVRPVKTRRVMVVHPRGSAAGDVMLKGISGPELLEAEAILADVHVPRGYAYMATEIDRTPEATP